MSMNHIIYAKKFSTDLGQFTLVAMNERLSKKDLRVFMFLCCRVGSTFPTSIDIKQGAKSLNMKSSEFKKSLSVLEEEGIITTENDKHSKKGYRMSYTGKDSILEDYEYYDNY